MTYSASSLGMMSDEEKKMQSIEDIKELLSYDYLHYCNLLVRDASR